MIKYRDTDCGLEKAAGSFIMVRGSDGNTEDVHSGLRSFRTSALVLVPRSSQSFVERQVRSKPLARRHRMEGFPVTFGGEFGVFFGRLNAYAIAAWKCSLVSPGLFNVVNY
jgi:hypothetical protein